MESSLLSIQALVSEVKNEIFSDGIYYGAFVNPSPSAYDTAWVAMIPDYEHENGPMFKGCLDWIINNQNEEGFWGETNEEDLATIDALTATLACLLALKTWNTGHQNIEIGLEFIHSKAEILLLRNWENLPRWFVLTFPAMIEFCEKAGVDLVFSDGLREVIADIFITRQHILDTESLVDETQYFPPLLSYLETLPSTYHFDTQHIILKHLSFNGSLFQSPSATARAFMVTGNVKCMKYLQSILQKFPYGAEVKRVYFAVPAKYPVDEDLIRMCMVDHVQRLGLAEHFNADIEKILAQVYGNQTDHYKSNPTDKSIIPEKLFKDALAFRLLRIQGHDVNPGSFCWFLHDQEFVAYMEENYEQFISPMYSVYRATDLRFPGENELEEARTFAIKMLEKFNTRNKDHMFFISKGLQNVIKYEMNVPWIARMDHIDHRMWIEESRNSPLWIGKASLYKLSCLDNKNLAQLAVKIFEFRQSIYAQELEELQRWSKKWRLSEMGFGREKTTVTYFATAASSCFPYNSKTRLEIAKSAIIVTVADDFYDMEGSLNELEILTDAVKRWDGKGLKGHGKTIFDALDDFVMNDIAAKWHPNIVPKLQDIWAETFDSWMVERSWSLSGYIPSMDEYLQTGMISIAAHTVALPATTFFFQNETQNPTKYDDITKLVMITSRLANDTQSYQKEEVDGKLNLVLLHLKQNPKMSTEDSIIYVKNILDLKKKEFMKHVFMDDLPKSYKSMHLSCMKVFQMFFNSENLYDSETALLDAIKKAIYLPIDQNKPFLKPLPSVPYQEKNENKTYKIIPSNPSEKKKKNEIFSGFRTKVSVDKQRFAKNFSAVGFKLRFV